MWSLEFDETGGYDCISSAYVISNATVVLNKLGL